ncbi:MAG TPA: HD domain-containing phosphohydrolase [Candidatus Limnocylindrales bacterium]|nr:HD domain-containing phosphohydrolase [Candidatus Limnocylindrales bacterium]
MTSAERRLQSLVQRGRVALALGILAAVGIAQQLGVAEEVLGRGLAVGLLLAAAAVLDELIERRGRRIVGAAAGLTLEFAALGLAVALFDRFTPLAPAALLWPIIDGATFLGPVPVLYIAALATASVLEIRLLTGPGTLDLVTAGAWGALYFAVAALAGAATSALRRSQRRAEQVYASIASLSAAASYPELAQMLFAYAERLLDLPSDAPAALLFDERGIGVHGALSVRGLDPEERARFRVAGADAARLVSLAGEGAWLAPAAAFPAGASQIPEPLAGGSLFVLPLRDARRLVGFLVARRERPRRLDPGSRAALGRLSEQAGGSAVRIRGRHAVEAQHHVIAAALGGRDLGAAEREIASWLVRNAREIAKADRCAVIEDRPDGACLVLDAHGFVGESLEHDVLPLVREARRSGVAVIVPDGASEKRVALPAALRTGASALLPVPGEGAYLLVHRAERYGLHAGDLQLLVLLTDHAVQLFSGARSGSYLRAREDLTSGAPASTEPRLATLASHTGSGPDSEFRARLIEAFRLALEGNQPQLTGSGDRVAAITGALAEALAVDRSTRDDLYIASLLRDVGELGIDRRLLDVPRRLTPAEREVVERHPLLGEAILATIQLGGAAAIVRSHHERWDGTGYPGELGGEEIPIAARILAVADALVAMSSERPHRSALSAGEAVAVLLEARGRAYDPAVVDALTRLSEAGTVVLASPTAAPI